MADPLERLYRPSSPALPDEEFADRLRRRIEATLRDSTERRTVMTEHPEARAALIPSLAVRDAAGAIEFYRRAFDAEEISRMTLPNGTIAHAEVAIGGSRLALKDEEDAYGDLGPQSLGGTTVRLLLRVDDVDAVVERAVAAGATVVIPVDDRPYGNRDGRLQDPFGHYWIVFTPLSS